MRKMVPLLVLLVALSVLTSFASGILKSVLEFAVIYVYLTVLPEFVRAVKPATDRFIKSVSERVPAPVILWVSMLLLGEVRFAESNIRLWFLGLVILHGVTFYIVYAFEQIAREATQGTSPTATVSRISWSLLLVVVTYAFLYVEIFRIDPGSFVGIPDGSDWFDAFLHFLYFAGLTTATISFGDIRPEALSAKFFVFTQVAAVFVYVAYLLSNFGLFREAFRRSHPFALAAGDKGPRVET